MSNNPAAYYSISLKLGIKFDHVIPDLLQTLKVKESNVKVTACYKN